LKRIDPWYGGVLWIIELTNSGDQEVRRDGVGLSMFDIFSEQNLYGRVPLVGFGISSSFFYHAVEPNVLVEVPFLRNSDQVGMDLVTSGVQSAPVWVSLERI